MDQKLPTPAALDALEAVTRELAELPPAERLWVINYLRAEVGQEPLPVLHPHLVSP